MSRRRRIIVNNDFYNIFQIEPPVEDQDVLDAVDKLAGTQVDTLTVDAPTGFGEGSMVEPALRALYSHPEGDTCLDNLETFRAAGKDPFQMLLDRARDKDLEFLASFRLNDTHYKDQIFNPFLEQFYYDNQHSLVGQTSGRENTEFDYRKSAVRDHYFGYIRQTLESYDVDGVELNFTRNCRFFPQPFAAECAPVMTQFVKEVRGLLEQYGRERGRKLCLAATVPYSLCRCRQEGLDLPAWARLGLIDLVNMSTPFLAEFNHDIHDTKMKLPGVQVYGGCDRNLSYSFGESGSRVVPMHTYRAMAMNYLNQGADGIYLYDVMAWTMNFNKASAAVKRHGGQGDTGDSPIDYDRQLINELGSLKTLEFLDKLYLLTAGPESVDCPGATLPVTVPAGGEVSLRLTIGDDIANAVKKQRLAKVWLQTISSDCDNYDNYTVELNAVDLSRQYAFVPYAEKPNEALLFPEPGRSGELPPLEKVRRHPVRPIDLHRGVNFISIKSYRDPLTISGVELAICYRQD